MREESWEPLRSRARKKDYRRYVREPISRLQSRVVLIFDRNLGRRAAIETNEPPNKTSDPECVLYDIATDSTAKGCPMVRICPMFASLRRPASKSG